MQTEFSSYFSFKFGFNTSHNAQSLSPVSDLKAKDHFSLDDFRILIKLLFCLCFLTPFYGRKKILCNAFLVLIAHGPLSRSAKIPIAHHPAVPKKRVIATRTRVLPVPSAMFLDKRMCEWEIHCTRLESTTREDSHLAPFAMPLVFSNSQKK